MLRNYPNNKHTFVDYWDTVSEEINKLNNNDNFDTEKLSLENHKLRETLETILCNTLNRDFGGDIIYKSMVLSNIEYALGKESFEKCEALYKI